LLSGLTDRLVQVNRFCPSRKRRGALARESTRPPPVAPPFPDCARDRGKTEE
jgi:hypothetical protein